MLTVFVKFTIISFRGGLRYVMIKVCHDSLPALVFKNLYLTNQDNELMGIFQILKISSWLFLGQ